MNDTEASGSIAADAGTPSTSDDRGVSWRSVALPSEHGGWSLTAEPALLGLIVAWSLPGLALGIAAMVAFIARTPLKLVLVDRFRHRRLPRTGLAARIAAGELAVLLLLVVYAVAAGESFWVPFAVAAPLIVLESWFDIRSRGRRLVPELAGSIGIGSIATAIALADGAGTRLAWGLWVVVAARSVVVLHLADVKGPVRDVLRNAGLWDQMGERIHTSTNDAVGAIAANRPGPGDQRRHGIDERAPLAMEAESHV